MKARVISILKDGRIMEDLCDSPYTIKTAVNDIKSFIYGDFIAVFVIVDDRIVRMEFAK